MSVCCRTIYVYLVSCSCRLQLSLKWCSRAFCILSPSSFGSSAHKRKQVPRKLCTIVYYAIHFVWNVPYKMLWSKCLRSRTASLRRVDASLFPSFRSRATLFTHLLTWSYLQQLRSSHTHCLRRQVQAPSRQTTTTVSMAPWFLETHFLWCGWEHK